MPLIGEYLLIDYENTNIFALPKNRDGHSWIGPSTLCCSYNSHRI